MSNVTGSCLCGKINYSISSTLKNLLICHCDHCKKISGSAFSLNFIVKEEDIKLDGEPKVYTDAGDSGNPVYRSFCSDCGSPLFARINSAPNRVVLKAGTLSDITAYKPVAEIYCSKSLNWLPEMPGTAKNETA